MSFLQSALQLADLGFHVFPLEPDGKLPKIKNFPELATKDPKQISKWWTDPVLGLEKQFNIGISTSNYNSQQSLVVVDVDNKEGKHGSDELLKLELEGFTFSKTLSQTTPTGGKHLIYRAPKSVKQGVSVLGEGLDIRSQGGYIVGPGSRIGGKFYELDNPSSLEIAECPQWILNVCAQMKLPDAKFVDPAEIDHDRAVMRAGHYLEKEAPLAVEGQGGDHTTFKVASRIKDFGVDEASAIELMLDLWNDRCEPPWAPDELQKKVQNAYRYGSLTPGQRAPEVEFQKIEQEPAAPGAKETEVSFLVDMNSKYAIIFGDGNHTILHETVDEKGRPRRVFMSEVSFKRKFSPKLVQQGKGKAKTWAEVWLDWEQRRTYRGLCFKPELKPRNGYYNLWRGFTCQPVPYQEASKQARLGLDMFLEHAKQNVCGGNEELFQWLMGYFAHLIQKPFERPLTTLVFRGSKGTGKNALVDRIGALLGVGHYLVAHNSRYLTSNFNGHLDSALCLVLDEAFWSGDKSADSILKGLTTSPEILIERKGRDPYTVDNLVRLVIIGNEDWLVPASADERRYAVYDVGEGRKQDIPFFEKMCALIDKKGGNEVLLHYFKTFDLSKVNVNKAPATKGLLDQKIASLDLEEEFWFQCLQEGRIVGSDFSKGWTTSISKALFRDAFILFCKKKNSRTRIPSAIAIGRKLIQMCPQINTRGKCKAEDSDEWINSYVVPSLEVCRTLMDKWLGQEIEWD